jgi:hypothetical protein
VAVRGRASAEESNMAGVILPFFRKWTAVAGPNVHPSDVHELTGYFNLLIEVQVSGLIAGPLNIQPMQSMDGQIWAAGAVVACALGYTPIALNNPMRFVRLDAQGAGAGTIASFFAIGVARDA